MGSLRAKQNWYDCFDPKHETDRSKKLKFQIVSQNDKINKIKSSLSVILNDQDFENLMSECYKFMESEQETIEQSIEKEHRPSGAFLDKKFFGETKCPSGVYFNKNALVVLTETEIPEDIRLGLSFGHKFLFPYVCDDNNLLELLAQLELTILNTIPDLRQLEVSTEIFHILKNRDSLQYDNNKRWLSFVNKRTVNFLDSNKNIFATKSDKGGHTVIMDVSDYETRLEALLSDKNYSKIYTDPLPQLIAEEKRLVKHILGLEPVKDMGIHKDIKVGFEPDTLQLPKFYGLPKIHKKGFPLRPITPTCNATGYYLAKIFNKMLERVFPRSDHHIRDTEEFVDFINNIIISANDVLVSFDVVSMFTNILYELVFDIVMDKYQDFADIFSIAPIELRQILKFLLQDCTVFTALGHTYKQKDGLPMGSCISPTLARIVMDVIINKLLAEIPSISFIKVFVDDTIAAIDRSLVEKALETLNNFKVGIKFTLERENDSFSINFLNVTLTRDKQDEVEDSPRTVVTTNWYRKPFASGRLLNYYSSHKRTTVLGTAINFIKTVIYLSDGRYFHENKQKIIDSLKENSFPEGIISVLMNDYYTYMRPKHCKPSKLTERQPEKPNDSILSKIKTDEESENPYEMFPHSICKGRSIKSVLHKHKKPGKILADSVRNTKVNSVTTRKTITPLEKRKKLILFSECICKKKVRIISTGFNETGEITSKKVLNRKMTCDIHGHAFKEVKFRRGLYYSSQTKRLANFLQWKHRKRLDHFLPVEFPMNHLAKLLK